MLFWRAAPLLCALVLLSGSSEAGATPALSLPREELRRFSDALDAFRTGEWAAAAAGFRSVLGEPALLGEYARFFLAESLSRAGDLPGARRVAESIDCCAGGGVALRALLQLAFLAQQEGDEPSAEATFRRFLSEFPHRPEAPRVRYLLALSLESQGRSEEAARVFRELWLLSPASAYAEAASDQLARLERAGARLPTPSAVERLDRAERLLASGMAGVARDEAEAILASRPDSESALRALAVVAGAWRRLGRHAVAARAIDRALARAPRDRHPGLLLEMARLQERSGSWESALGTAARLLGEHPAAREAPQALLLRGRVFEENGRVDEASAAYRRLAKEFPLDEAAATALWRLGWRAFIQGDLERAARHFATLATPPTARGYRLPAAYWAGRSWDGKGEPAEASRFYAVALREAPRSYYGLLAARRIKGIRIDPAHPAAAQLPADPLAPLAGDLRLARAEALREVGLTDFAAVELEQLLASSADDLPRLYGVSALYVRYEQYHLALRILRASFAELASNPSPALPRAFWELFYPMGWARELKEASARAGLDPHLVAAVVREESSFSPLARSRAGARGLMQLMPETARPMAARRGMGFGRGELLDSPEVNLQMGTAFLAGLIREFGEPRVALAAYNAGPARVRKWWGARRSDDVEMFVEQIPLDETRYFVRRVMVAWEEYRRVWGDRAPPEEAR